VEITQNFGFFCGKLGTVTKILDLVAFRDLCVTQSKFLPPPLRFWGEKGSKILGWVCPGTAGGKILGAGQKLFSASVNGPLGVQNNQFGSASSKHLGTVAPGNSEIFEIYAFLAKFGASHDI